MMQETRLLVLDLNTSLKTRRFMKVVGLDHEAEVLDLGIAGEVLVSGLDCDIPKPMTCKEKAKVFQQCNY